jgi:hypothetical protein
MSLHIVSMRLRIVVTSFLCAAGTAFVAGPHARAQVPSPAEQPAVDAEVEDALPGEPAPIEAAPGTAPSSPAASGQEMPEKQRKALALLAEGRALAEEFLLVDAIVKYREALTYWEHPIIHYNLALLLNALERTLEAYRSVEHALQADPATLSDDPVQAQQIHAHLLRLRDQLRARLVEVEITSARPKVEVSIGNRTVAPASSEMFLPGTHRLAAREPRHWPLLQAMALDSGATVHLRLASRRAITPWKPWVLTGAGTAVALAGFGIYWHGRNQYDALASQVESQCQPGCPGDMRSAFDNDWRRVRRLQDVGVGTLVTGGTAALLGAGLVLWNQRRELRLIGSEQHPVSIVPVASPEMTGVVGATTF